MLTDKYERVLGKAGKIPEKFVEIDSGRGTERSDLRYKEKILGSSQRKHELRNKEFDCRKR